MLINFVDATNNANHYTKPPPYKVSQPSCFWLTWAAGLLNVLINCLNYSFYFSGSVSWFKGLTQSSFTRLSQMRTMPTHSHSSLFLSLVSSTSFPG